MHRIKGTYRFYQNGRLIGKSENMITDAGKRHIYRYLAGQEGQLAGAIAVGTGSLEPRGSDDRLTYEFDRATINLVSPSYIDNKIIFKATLDRILVGTIYEVGLYSTSFGSLSTGNPSRPLVSFEASSESWSSDSFVSGNQRIGNDSLRLAPAAGGTLTSNLPSVGLNLSGYTNSDRISLAFHSANANASSVRLRLIGENPADYYEMLVNTPISGYNVVSVPRSELTKNGAASFTNIDSLEVSVSSTATGAAQVDFDGARIEAFSPDVENILVSRALVSPIVKTDVGEMDIEYALEVTI